MIQTPTAEHFTLELGMPHLGRIGLNENALLKAIGHDRWQMLEQMGGIRTHEIRDAFDNRLYATYCFVELALSPARPLSYYNENDRLCFSRNLNHYGRIYLDGRYQLTNGGPFELRCTNVFIYQLAGPQQLKMAQAENCDFDRIFELLSQPDSLDICRAAKAEGTFQGPDSNPGNLGSREVKYQLDPDRDTNGAGLIYFANFICFLDSAERALLNDVGAPDDLIDARSTYWRRLGYFGNAQSTEQLQIKIRGGVRVLDKRFVSFAFDYSVSRISDGKLILVSSSRKSAELNDVGQKWINTLTEQPSPGGV
jgi:probable biosynthetic protein (TIGR04098 family)